MKIKQEKTKRNCHYFTEDRSYCDLICPKILQFEDVTHEECEFCGYSASQTEDNSYCKK